MIDWLNAHVLEVLIAAFGAPMLFELKAIRNQLYIVSRQLEPVANEARRRQHALDFDD